MAAGESWAPATGEVPWKLLKSAAKVASGGSVGGVPSGAPESLQATGASRTAPSNNARVVIAFISLLDLLGLGAQTIPALVCRTVTPVTRKSSAKSPERAFL